MEKIESAVITLLSSIKECDSHKNRIKKKLESVNNELPINEYKLKAEVI